MYVFYLGNILRIYIMIRYMHGAYISYLFIKWMIISGYEGFGWILSFIPIPALQIDDKQTYYEIETDNYIHITYLKD